MGEGDGDEAGEGGRSGRGRAAGMKLVKVEEGDGDGEGRAEQAGKAKGKSEGGNWMAEKIRLNWKNKIFGGHPRSCWLLCTVCTHRLQSHLSPWVT